MSVRTVAGTTTSNMPMGGYRDGPGAIALMRSPAGLEVVSKARGH
jgi:hypothetical protein